MSLVVVAVGAAKDTVVALVPMLVMVLVGTVRSATFVLEVTTLVAPIGLPFHSSALIVPASAEVMAWVLSACRCICASMLCRK